MKPLASFAEAAPDAVRRLRLALDQRADAGQPTEVADLSMRILRDPPTQELFVRLLVLLADGTELAIDTQEPRSILAQAQELESRASPRVH